MNDTKKPEDEYNVWIWGSKVPKIDANRFGIAVIIGFVGVIFSFMIFGPQNKLIAFLISLALASIGYFGVAKKIFKDKNKT
jgi:hypothetical protein